MPHEAITLLPRTAGDLLGIGLNKDDLANKRAFDACLEKPVSYCGGNLPTTSYGFGPDDLLRQLDLDFVASTLPTKRTRHTIGYGFDCPDHRHWIGRSCWCTS